MVDPKIELIPSCSAICSDSDVTIDILVRATTSVDAQRPTRPPLNLGLVIDKSGSMSSGRKLEQAREAAIFAVEQLLPTDRVSVIAYDSEVEVLVPSTVASRKESIIARIRGIQAGSATALHDGWKTGATQVLEHARPGLLNRVLLLSDGLANNGLCDPNAIAADARRVAQGGVTTSTMGVGDDYNEDLMEAMATQGQGNYYFIENAVQLTDIFQTELHDLMALVGHRVSLGVEPSPGVHVLEVLNDFDRLKTGRWKLPNLVAGNIVRVVVRLKVDKRPTRSPIARFRVAWDSSRQDQRTARSLTLELPAVAMANWEQLDKDPEVVEQVGLLMSARARREAAEAMRNHDYDLCSAQLGTARRFTEALPSSPETVGDLSAIDRLEKDLALRQDARFIKRSKQHHYGRTHGKDLT